MKTDLLLQSLNAQLLRLEQDIRPMAFHATLGRRFDRQLFRSQSPFLQACVEEARENLRALEHAVAQRQTAQVVWLAEHLAAQLEAIARESAAWALRGWDSGSPTLTRWQRKRLRHQDYERRLLAMMQAREQQLAQATSLADQQRLSREIDAFRGRLARCRDALQNIETVLARLTR